jgi:hypothetical protein
MPIIAAVEDSDGLGEVEVEEAEGRESPFLIIETIDAC